MAQRDDRLREEEEAAARPSASAARLFDVRRVIGGLFVVYGVVVAAIGMFDSTAQIAKAQGVNINLWAGLAMLAFGVLFLVWQWLRPAQAPSAAGGSDRGGSDRG
jgi:hypothetical protein